MTIGQLARQTGTPASTIRYYEQLGLLPKPARVSGQRRYAEDAVARLGVVLLAQRCGFRLDEIGRLLHGFSADAPPSRRWRNFAEGKQAEIEARIDQLRAMQRLLRRVMACRCADLKECGRRAVGL
jgi:MerR family redox-sensitive transcriptional activator SoxR